MWNETKEEANVARLKPVDIQGQLANKMDEVIKEQTETKLNVDETWTKLRDTVYQGALDVLSTTYSNTVIVQSEKGVSVHPPEIIF